MRPTLEAMVRKFNRMPNATHLLNGATRLSRRLNVLTAHRFGEGDELLVRPALSEQLTRITHFDHAASI